MSHNPDTQDRNGLIGDIERFLQETVLTAKPVEERASGKRRGRKRILPALVLWSGLIVAVLRGLKSQRAIWRLVGLEGLWDFPVYEISDQAVYARLAAEDASGLKQLFEQVRDGLRSALEPLSKKEIAPFASGVYALDGSTLDKVRRHLPWLREVPNGDKRLLPGKLAGVFDIRLQQWRELLHLSNPDQNEKTVARDLVSSLPSKSLILADLGYFSFAWFDWLTDNRFWWLSRLRQKTSFEVLHTFYKGPDGLFDGIVWLGKHRADRAAHAVRLVSFKVGKTQHRYICNVLDPKQLSIHDIAVLYARRWDIELAFKMVKRHLNLHLLWSAKPNIILQQLWAVLILSQILHAMQMKIAAEAGVDPFDVSLELLTQYVPRLAQQGKDPVALLVEKGRHFGFIRPSRRIRPKTPAIDALPMNPLPENLKLKRKPRYAQRRCNRRSEDPEPSPPDVDVGVQWFPYR